LRGPNLSTTVRTISVTVKGSNLVSLVLFSQYVGNEEATDMLLQAAQRVGELDRKRNQKVVLLAGQEVPS